MSERFRIAGADAAKNTAQDAPGTIFSRGGATLVSPLFEHAHPQRSLSCLNVIEKFRAIEDDVDAVVPVDAKNAPTSDLEDCKDRSFQQRPHRSLFLEEEKKERRTNDKNTSTQLSTKSDQVQLYERGVQEDKQPRPSSRATS